MLGSRRGATSLGGEMMRYGGIEELLGEAMVTLRAALESAVTHLPKSMKEQSVDFRKNIKEVCNETESSHSPDLLKDVRKRVDREFQLLGRRIDDRFESHSQETKGALAAIAVIAESLSAGEKTHSVRFKGISRKLRLLTTSNDLTEVRRKLADEVEMLEKYVDEMSRDTQTALQRLNQATTTPKPPAASCGQTRKQLEDAIRARISKGERFAVVRLHSEGHAKNLAEEGALDLVVRRLADVFEAPDAAGVWTEDSFLALTRLPLPETAARIDIVERDLSNKLGQRIDGTALESRPGDNPAALLARIEQMAQPVGAK